MRLTRIAAGNVLSLEYVEIELTDGLTVFVGPNGSGKTNLVRLVTMAGLALEWLEERSSPTSSLAVTQSVQDAMASYALARFRTAGSGVPMWAEIGLKMGEEDLEDLACFMRAAITSTLISEGQGRQLPDLGEWADKHVLTSSLADLGNGTLVLRHEGSSDAPWDVSWQFQSGCGRYRWGLSDPGGGRLLALTESGATQRAGNGGYTQLWEAFFGSPAGGGSPEVPPLADFDLSLLLRQDGRPVQAPLVYTNGTQLEPALAPHRTFADMAGIPLWNQRPNRVYSLAWLLRRVFQRGLAIIGEQFRGIGTMTTPPRPAGRYSIGELASQAPGLEPYALPLRLMRLKNGSLGERGRFHRIQALFAELASGRGMDLSFQVTAAPQAAGQQEVTGHDAEAAVTILIAQDAGTGTAWELPVQLCGAGTWEALVLAEALVSDDDRVVILDEPALNLHPGWQQLLLDRLRERGGQSVLITHSPYLLPMENEDDIYRIVRVSHRDGTTCLSRASRPVPDPRAVVRDYSMSADARALLFASGAVLVEGETELGALPLWFAKSPSAETLGSPRRLHLAFYSVGGETHFKAPLTLLAALEIPWVIVCDGGPLRPDTGGRHIFRQVAAAGHRRPELEEFTTLVLSDPATAAKLTFGEAAAEARRYGIFTLAPDWDRTKTDGITAESFEAFVEAAPGLAGQLAAAKAEVGNSKVRQGRWLAENHQCPGTVDRLYADIVHALWPEEVHQ